MSKRSSTSPFKFSGERAAESEDECFSSVQKSHQDFEKIMQVRAISLLQASLPEVDMEDFDAQHDAEKESRQFAPEYAQNCYEDMMLNQNKAIGNYLKPCNSLKITA